MLSGRTTRKHFSCPPCGTVAKHFALHRGTTLNRLPCELSRKQLSCRPLTCSPIGGRARSGASPTVAVLCVQLEMAHPAARRKGSQQLPLHWRHRAHCVWAASRVACREVIACEG